ncbi:HlyD family type I secretion periplasmic adaptor subunit [Nitrospira tepida]|uniref:HlyD family type I secretion periplasmic adaptor subunit n=1 Tax=Nitrospira tepida TaxID=2973512 RepID=A0AA86JY07_9BACT|nr:HlyD family type I secretion periplasmic adaptor subunit [Nitrospira tepida]CAI4029617.1 HlyD family type I secretion periplasmic adaptor subunit [Nitrospira tepida]
MTLIQTLSRHLSVWRAAWQFETAKPLAAVPQGKAVEFLPAVLEIQEAPPSPIGRAILWTILFVFTAAVTWACLGWIDIVATAQGKIIPSGHSKVIQPVIQQFETGIVRSIHVQDGQVVKKGDLLIELDPTQNRADRDRAANEYRAATVEAARLRALIAGQPAFDAPPDGDPQYIRLQQQLLRDQLAEYQARVEAARHLIDQRRAALEATKENIRRLEATVPIEAERAAAYKQLLANQFVSRMDYLQFEQQRIDKAQELAGQRSKLRQDRAALAEAEKSYRALVSEFLQTKQAELSATETKARSLAQEVVKTEQRTDLQRLISPIDGVVQQLAVHTLGGVVTPAQPLMMVVPQDHPVEVEAQVENKDVGFVKEGQPVEIKVETFPFTLYGTIPGNVLSVSDDAAPVEKVGLVYPTRVSLDRATIQVEGKLVNLSPGMAVTVEIKTGQRRVIEYLLSPLLKSVQESLRER